MRPITLFVSTKNGRAYYVTQSDKGFEVDVLKGRAIALAVGKAMILLGENWQIVLETTPVVSIVNLTGLLEVGKDTPLKILQIDPEILARVRREKYPEPVD